LRSLLQISIAMYQINLDLSFLFKIDLLPVHGLSLTHLCPASRIAIDDVLSCIGHLPLSFLGLLVLMQDHANSTKSCKEKTVPWKQEKKKTGQRAKSLQELTYMAIAICQMPIVLGQSLSCISSAIFHQSPLHTT
jgi:hypothetical protein